MMSADKKWPPSLVRELAERRCIIHLGSGMSCSSKSKINTEVTPPSWKLLLETLRDSTLSGPKNKSLVNEFIKNNKFLDAAEVIKLNGKSAEYNAKLYEIFISHDYLPSEAHDILASKITPKIITTTNYDTIIEGALIENSGHNSFIQFEHSTDGLLDAIRSPSTILIKMHGCAKHPNATILSRSDYFSLRKNHPSFFNTISALFKINTVLFIGCGIEDPDINLILENNNITNDSSNPHYALVGDKSYAFKLKATIKSQYNIDLITYNQKSKDDHSGFIAMIRHLEQELTEERTKLGIQ